MGWPAVQLWYDNLGGFNAQQDLNLREDTELLDFSTAENVIPDPIGEIVTREGFSNVRASAISGTPSITGMSHLLRAVTDKFVIALSNGKLAIDDANPPVVLVGGTDFTSGVDNLVRFDVHESLLICASRLRDLPQTINSSGTKADLGGTPPQGLDYRVFGRRGFMISPKVGGTVHHEKSVFNSANDDHDAWANPVTANFLNFGRPGSGVELVGAEYHADHLMHYTQDKVFAVYTTPTAVAPFGFQEDIFSEEGGGPVGAHAIVSAGGAVYWISQNFDVKRQKGFVVDSIGYNIQPFIRGLSNSRREFIVGGFEPKYRMVWWAVSDGSDTQHKNIVALQIDTGHYYIFTIQVNALATRKVSGEQRLIGGHNNGLFSNMFDGSTTGNLQDAAAIIGTTIRTKRMHLGLPAAFKKVPFMVLQFDPIGSEVITIKHDIDDSGSFTAFDESPHTVSGTDVNEVYLDIPGPFKNIRLEITNAISGDRVRLARIGFPAPTVVRTVMS